MQTKLNPYLSFEKNAREAMEFYKSVFGGELKISTFGESGMAKDPNDANNIMHSQLDSPNGMTLMGADTPIGMNRTYGDNVSVSLSGDNETELTGYFNKLSEGGQVSVPLAKAPWGDAFGMFIDRFGIQWLVNITSSNPAA